MSADFKKIYAPNLVALLLDEPREHDCAGRIMHLYDVAGEPFNALSDIVIRLDELYDEWKHPQRATTQRLFKEAEKEPQRAPRTDHLATREKARTIDELYEVRGELATYMLHVEYRQNASWQGCAIRLETGSTLRFQSVLELMRAITADIRETTGETIA